MTLNISNNAMLKNKHKDMAKAMYKKRLFLCRLGEMGE
jgi:hypothetical protein